MFGIDKEKLRFLKRLNTPAKIQDYLDTLRRNFDADDDMVCLPPLRVIEEKKCHCVEGAVLAALCLRLQGAEPLLLDLTATRNDLDHVVALFWKYGCWGAISKTNHAVLRYREPVYRSIRELVVSYFHEYTDDAGRKTLRSYSNPVNLKRFDKQGWMTTREDIFYIPQYLSEVKHIPVVDRRQIRSLRRIDPIELKAGDLVDWPEPGKKRID